MTCRVTFTTRPAAHAILYGPQPPRTGKRGHPAWKGERLGTAAEMAVGATWLRARVTRYGVTEDVDLAVIACPPAPGAADSSPASSTARS
ncbi:transposase, IS4 family [Streptomyces hygroscopicus]|nr:transposase, IS4 family [Streptomyces hygroscopicus]